MSAPHRNSLQPMLDRLAQRTSLSDQDSDALLSLPHRRSHFDASAYIVRDGDSADSCGVLLDGFVYRHKVTGGGARQILSIHMRGDIVDLQNSLLGYADHNVQALTQVELAIIPRSALLKLCAEHAAIAQAFWRDTLVDASIFREWIVNVGRRDARQRIAHLFCEIALRQEAAGLCEGPNYAWPMTQEQVGDATGLTSVHVNRTLQGMRSEGLVTTSKRRVTIADWTGLQTAGDFSRAYLHQTREAA